MRWRSATCGCVIDYGLWRDGTDYASATMDPENIAAKCPAHVAAQSVDDLEALVVPENEALARACAIISSDTSTNDRFRNDATGLREWSLNGLRQVVINVAGLTFDADGQMAAVPGVVYGSGITPGGGGRESATWIGPTVSHSIGTGQRVIQGNNQRPYSYHYSTWLEYADYFPLVGNGILEIMYETLFSGWTGEDPRYRLTKHAVDFGGVVDFFTVKISANMRTKAVHYRARINNVDTEQWCMVPPYRAGVFQCIGDAAAFVSGDTLVGYCSSERVTPVFNPLTSNQSSYINLRAVHCELQPTTGCHTIFRASGGVSLDNDSGIPTAIVGSAYALAGDLYHYWTDLTQGPLLALRETAEERMQMLVRAKGTFGYLQSALEPPLNSGDEVTFNFRRDKEDREGGDLFPNLSFLDTDTFAYRYDIDTGNTAEVQSGDKVSVTGLNVSGENATVFGVGVNWRGGVGNVLVDHQVTESHADSFTNSQGDRDDKFPFVVMEGSVITDEYWASPIGSFSPKTRDQIKHMPLGWDDILVRPSFQTKIKYLRAFHDATTTENQVRINIGVGNGDPLNGPGVGDLQVHVLEEPNKWYEDNLSGEEISANLGFCLRFKGIVGDIETKIHVSTICFSYTDESATGRGDSDEGCFPRVLPTAVEVTKEPCTTHRSRCVKITRADGEVFAYTEHDEDITYNGTTYRTRGGLSSSASELGSVLGEVGNIELRGTAREMGVSVDDLFGGKFDGATVDTYLIPWGDFIETENVVRLGGGVLGKTSQDLNTFTIEGLSPSAYLRQKSLLKIYTPTCRWELGDSNCTVNLTSSIVSGSVTGLTNEITQTGATVRRRFFDTSRSEDDGWFDEGLITFVTGANAGQTSKIKEFVSDEIILWEPLIHVIAVGDTYTMKPGCDKRADTCKDKFDNWVNFGGFPTIPGLDATAKTPSGKMGN